ALQLTIPGTHSGSIGFHGPARTASAARTGGRSGHRPAGAGERHISETNVPGFPLSRFPADVDRSFHIDHRHLDADRGPVLDRAQPDRFGFLPRTDRLL